MIRPVSGYLFVYGTLLPGREPAHLRDLTRRLRDLGSATVHGRLYDCGPYPGLQLELGDIVVHGRLLELPDAAALAELDAYEGFDPVHPEGSLFRRVECETVCRGSRFDCWVYIYNRDVSDLPCVESGRWGD